MGLVGTSEGIGGLGIELLGDGGELACGHHSVGVENQQIVAYGALGTIVAALSGTAVLLIIIVDVEFSGIFVAHRLTRNRRAVFDYQHFEVGLRLSCEAVEELIDFVGAVIDWYNDGIFHRQRCSGRPSSGHNTIKKGKEVRHRCGLSSRPLPVYLSLFRKSQYPLTSR
jgi:hypothetical protein